MAREYGAFTDAELKTSRTLGVLLSIFGLVWLVEAAAFVLILWAQGVIL